MPMIAKLLNEHNQLRRMGRQLGRLIAEPRPPEQVGLFEVRREFASLLVAHLKNEDWVLYPRLLASKDRSIAATARQFIDELGGLSDAYARHTRSWTAFTIAADWEGYCRDTALLIAALDERIEREDRELYPLMQQVDQAA